MGGRVFFNVKLRRRQGGNSSGLSAVLDAIGLLYALTPANFVQSRAKPPEDIPEVVERYFKQGVDNLFQNYDAAGVMFRTTLEIALKIRFPKTKAKNLNDRINNAVEQGNLTSDLAAWAHEIRLGGNEAVHDEPLSQEEAQDLRDFTELVLLYLFTLPEKLARAKARREPDLPPPQYEDEIPF